jgi:hypothetical protein
MIINFYDPELNTAELDNRPDRKPLRCSRCFRKIAMVKDRVNRIDCDAGCKTVTKLVSYHFNCWLKEVNNL